MDNLIQPEDLLRDCRKAEEYQFTLYLTPKDAEMFRQYAERIKCTDAALLQIFINDLVKGEFHTNDEVSKKANKWYEDMDYWRILQSQVERMPVKKVRFKDGGSTTAHGTKFEIREQMEKRFPGREIAVIV